MAKFWKTLLWILVGIALLAAVLYAFTYLMPKIGAYSKTLAVDNDWPMWLAGLLAPIIYLWNRLTDFVKGLFPGGSVARENEKIKAEQEKLRKEVERLVDWREASLKREFNEITRLQKEVAVLDEKLRKVDGRIMATLKAAPESFTEGLTDEEAHAKYFQTLRDKGYTVIE
jgi:hypothetical protein